MDSVGLEDKLARLIAAVAAIVYLVASAMAAPLVERCGRRTMMMVSTTIQGFCFFMLTSLLYCAQKPGYAGQHQVAQASIAFFFLYYVGFALGMLGIRRFIMPDKKVRTFELTLSIAWLYPTEINSLPMRTKGVRCISTLLRSRIPSHILASRPRWRLPQISSQTSSSSRSHPSASKPWTGSSTSSSRC